MAEVGLLVALCPSVPNTCRPGAVRCRALCASSSSRSAGRILTRRDPASVFACATVIQPLARSRAPTGGPATRPRRSPANARVATIARRAMWRRSARALRSSSPGGFEQCDDLLAPVDVGALGLRTFKRRRLPRAGLAGMWPYSTASSRICANRVINLLIVSAARGAFRCRHARRQQQYGRSRGPWPSEIDPPPLRDLGQAVVLKEGEEVVPQLPVVELDGRGPQLVPNLLEPLGREIVEGRLLGRRLDLAPRGRGRPDSPPHIGQDVRQLGLGLGASEAVRRAAERDVLALVVGDKPGRVGRALRAAP